MLEKIITYSFQEKDNSLNILVTACFNWSDLSYDWLILNKYSFNKVFYTDFFLGF